MFDTSPHRILARLVLALSLAAPIMTAAPEQAHAVIIDGVAARINAEIITLYDVRIAATPFMLQRGMDPSLLQDPTRRSKIYRQVLDDLIERKLLLQEAAKLGLSITDEEVEQWIAFTRQQQGLSEEQFKATIEQYGMNYTDYRAMMRQNLLRLRVTQFKVGAKVSISDAEVEARYRERYGELSLTERYITVSHVLIIPSEDTPQGRQAAFQRAKVARDRILAGEKFEDVARQESDGPSAKTGGKIGTYRRGELDADFENAAFTLEENRLSEIVRTKYGYHVILVSKIEERENPDIEERKDEIRGELRQIATERQLQSYMQGLRDRAFVEVKI